jgi:hypothetical protein
MEENKMNKFKIFSLVAGTLSFVIILIIGIVGIHISVDGFAGGTQHETISMFKNSSDGSIASNYSTTLGVALFFGVVALVLGIVSAFVKGKSGYCFSFGWTGNDLFNIRYHFIWSVWIKNLMLMILMVDTITQMIPKMIFLLISIVIVEVLH